MSDKELWELMSIICEGQDSEQRREVEQYITDLQKEIDRLGKLFYERNEENIRLNNIINELEKRIEKAIKYIEDTSYKSYFSMLQADYNMSLDTLINILKGEVKSE